MNKGFSLLELLVVVGIMAMLGVAATGGYKALTRGMADRGAVDAASSILRAAEERAHVDRQRTVVFCYNRLLKQASGDDSSDEVVGVMTAVKRVGRISYVSGDELYDEFGDLDQTYQSVDTNAEAKQGRGMRLFKMGGGNINKLQYSIVSDRVRYTDDKMETLFSDPCNGIQKTNLLMCAFVDLGTSQHKPSSWQVGDGYGMVFAELTLPRGYIFGSTVPANLGSVADVKTFNFRPEDNSSDTIEVWSTRPDASGKPVAFKKAGDATPRKDKGM